MRRYRLAKICGLLFVLVVSNLAGPMGAAGTDEILWQADPGRGWKNAGETGRPMLIYATMDGCVHCKRMEQTTFSNVSVRSHLNARFVPIYVSLDRHEKLIEHWRITTFPSTLLVAPNGNVLARLQGYLAAEELLRQTNAALAEVTPRTENAQAVAKQPTMR